MVLQPGFWVTSVISYIPVSQPQALQCTKLQPPALYISFRYFHPASKTQTPPDGWILSGGNANCYRLRTSYLRRNHANSSGADHLPFRCAGDVHRSQICNPSRIGGEREVGTGERKTEA